MIKTIRAEDLPADLKARQFLESVDLSEGEVIVEQNGKPRLLLMSPKLFELRRHAKEQLFVLIDQIRRRNPDVNSEALLQDLEEVDHPERHGP